MLRPLRWLVLLALAACAPDVPSPAERAAATDRIAATALERQLLAVPGVTSAHAALHTAFRDPLTNATSPAAASILITVAPGADRATIETTAHRLAPAATLALIAGPAPASSSSGKLLPIAALLSILGAAGYVAWHTRPRR